MTLTLIQQLIWRIESYNLKTEIVFVHKHIKSYYVLAHFYSHQLTQFSKEIL